MKLVGLGGFEPFEQLPDEEGIKTHFQFDWKVSEQFEQLPDEEGIKTSAFRANGNNSEV